MLRALVLTVAIFALPSTVSAHTLLASACGLPPLREHPGTVAFSCDGNVVFTGLHWTDWGQSTATGHGTLNLVGNSCIPDCASAPRYRYSATITASQIAYCPHSRHVYGLLVARLDEPDYQGQTVFRERLVSCV